MGNEKPMETQRIQLSNGLAVACHLHLSERIWYVIRVDLNSGVFSGAINDILTAKHISHIIPDHLCHGDKICFTFQALFTENKLLTFTDIYIMHLYNLLLT